MSNKTFTTISKAECLIVYKGMIEHSDQKWNSGKLTAESKDFGTATALAITSIEELIKALIIFLDGKGFEFRTVKGMQAFFRNHQIRYFVGYAMLAFALLGEELFKFIDSFRNNMEGLTLLHDEMKKDEKNFFNKKIKPKILRKMVILKSEFEWFSRVNLFRNDGLYCDFDNQFKNPIDINEADYREVYNRLEKIRECGKGIIEFLNIEDEMYVQQVTAIKKMMKEKKAYKGIGNGLAIIRETKGNPFELILQGLSKNLINP